MFYCEPCAKAAHWPTDFFMSRSHGPCELCSEVTVCFDVPSRNLPTPSKDLDDRLNRLHHVIEEEP